MRRAAWLMTAGILLGCGGGTLQAPSDTSRGDWLTTGGVSGQAAVLDGPTPPLQLLWSQNVGSPPVGGALLAGTALLQIAQDERVFAFDVTTGERLGRLGENGSACGPGAILGRHDEMLVLTESGKKTRLRAYDRKTRQVMWEKETPACAPIAGHLDTVLAVTEAGQLLSLATGSGDAYWQTALDHHPTTGALIVGDIAVVGGARGSLTAVNLSDGSIRWTAHLHSSRLDATAEEVHDSGAAVRGQLLAAADRIFATTSDGGVWSVDGADGTILWSTTVTGLPASGLSISGDRLIVGSSDRQVHALSTVDGGSVWDREMGGIVRGAPASSAGAIYVGSGDGVLSALEPATGEVIWSFGLDAPVYAPIVLARDLLVTTTQAGTVYLFAAPSALQ